MLNCEKLLELAKERNFLILVENVWVFQILLWLDQSPEIGVWDGWISAILWRLSSSSSAWENGWFYISPQFQIILGREQSSQEKGLSQVGQVGHSDYMHD